MSQTHANNGDNDNNCDNEKDEAYDDSQRFVEELFENTGNKNAIVKTFESPVLKPSIYGFSKDDKKHISRLDKTASIILFVIFLSICVFLGFAFL